MLLLHWGKFLGTKRPLNLKELAFAAKYFWKIAILFFFRFQIIWTPECRRCAGKCTSQSVLPGYFTYHWINLWQRLWFNLARVEYSSQNTVYSVFIEIEDIIRKAKTTWNVIYSRWAFLKNGHLLRQVLMFLKTKFLCYRVIWAGINIYTTEIILEYQLSNGMRTLNFTSVFNCVYVCWYF